VIALLVALAVTGTPPMKGVALGLYSEDAGFSYAPLLREIAGLGATHVEFVINLYQRDGASTELYTHTRFTPTDAALLAAAKQAKAAGLQVVLLPIVRLESPRDGEWRGNLKPSDAAAWWRSYEKIIVRYAGLARRAHASTLVIGSELSTLDGDPKPWQSVARAVRKQFRGQLVYAANWDHYRDVKAWPAVDAIGMSAYFDLAPEPTIRWGALRKELETFAAAQNKPLFFTEVGYLSQKGAAAWPWKEAATEPVDLEEQVRCYRAFTTAWADASSLGAVFFWNWYGWGGAGSRGYTPRGKPAAQEIQRWFARKR
jgi:glycosyl hydrolase family 113